MRRAHRLDANHTEICDALRKVGAVVQSLAGIGGGCPDVIVGYKGINVLMEIKQDHAWLTPAEEVWHSSWQGQVVVVRSQEEAIKAVLALTLDKRPKVGAESRTKERAR